ncbi:hypothetical protein A3D73_01875 [Candidatus Uhrbacteria bacterium RIFCSPHIGHO2_02_FULL_60_44]|nr:MAG: hypothetical protein A3D73_01875 [Candidatus Uhrbacteria bacterium RIFCSPHIGHO2_02_FULL_60_44]
MIMTFVAALGGCATELVDGAPADQGCATDGECEDGVDKTDDACLADGQCHHTWQESPESPDRQDAVFLCEDRGRTVCQKWPAVELETFTCENQLEVGAGTAWAEGGYPISLFAWRSKMPANRVRVLFTLRVGVYADRWIVQDLAKNAEVATLSAEELDADALELEMESGTDATRLDFMLVPDGNPTARAVQFSVEGLEDVETGIRYTTGCDGASRGTYGIFVRIPAHGILLIGEDADGHGTCAGEPRATDATEPHSNEFVRTVSDDRLYFISPEDGSKRPVPFGPDELRSWLYGAGYDPATFCAADLRILPDGALDVLVTGPPIAG